MADSSDLWIPFGRLTRAHGIRGELRLSHHNPEEPFPPEIHRVRLRRENGVPRLMTVVRSRPANTGTLLTFTGVGDRNAASELTGAEVEVAAADLPELAVGEFFLHELLGVEAQTESGTELGVVKRIQSNRGQDLICIETSNGELLVPLADETVYALDRVNRRVTLRLPEGLAEGLVE